MIYENFLYIDPGSTSALFAVMLGAIVGAGIYIKTKWQSLRLKKMNK
jgi:predicted transporter